MGENDLAIVSNSPPMVTLVFGLLIILFGSMLFTGLSDPQKVSMPSRSKVLAYYGGILALSVAAFLLIPPVLEKSEKPSAQTSPASSTDLLTTHQANVKQFQEALEKLDKSTEAERQEYQKRVRSEGSNDKEVIKAMEQLIEKFRRAAIETNNLSIAHTLPIEVRESLDKSRDSLAESYWNRIDALELMLKYFDNQDPSLMVDVQAQADEADKAIKQAVLYMMKARRQVSLE